MKRVIGIGNALTDMLVNLKTDSVLGRFKLAKGSMSLVDTRLQTEISKSVAGLPYSLSLGGSAGNTIRAMAQLGCSVGFIGKGGHACGAEHQKRKKDGEKFLFHQARSLSAFLARRSSRPWRTLMMMSKSMMHTKSTVESALISGEMRFLVME